MEKSTIAIYCDEHYIQRILEKILSSHFNLMMIKSLNDLSENENLLKIQCLIAYPFGSKGCQLALFREIKAHWQFIPLLFIDDGNRFELIQGCACQLSEKILDITDSANLVIDIQSAIQKSAFKRHTSLSEIELSKYPPRVRRALRYIHLNFDKIKNAKEVSGHLKISTKTFLDEFNKNHIPTFKQYLINLKLEYAACIGKYTTLSIKIIAKMCGFENENRFHKVWKRRYGQSFLNFRNKDKNIKQKRHSQSKNAIDFD